VKSFKCGANIVFSSVLYKCLQKKGGSGSKIIYV